MGRTPVRLRRRKTPVRLRQPSSFGSSPANQGRLFRFVAAFGSQSPGCGRRDQARPRSFFGSEFSNFELGTNFLVLGTAYCPFAGAGALSHLPSPFAGQRARGVGLGHGASRGGGRPPDYRSWRECHPEKLASSDQRLLERRYADNIQVQELASQLGRAGDSVSKSLGRIRRALLDCIQRKMPTTPIETRLARNVLQ